MTSNTDADSALPGQRTMWRIYVYMPKQSMKQSSEHTELLSTLEIEFEELFLQKVKLNYYKESSSYKVTGVSFTQCMIISKK